MDWFDREVEQLENDLEEGVITQKEFYRDMRDIRASYEQEAHDAAESTYNDYFS